MVGLVEMHYNLVSKMSEYKFVPYIHHVAWFKIYT